MNVKDRLKGCLICGAIGDSIGGKYEGQGSNQMIIHIDKKLDSLSNDFEVIKIRKRKIVNKL